MSTRGACGFRYNGKLFVTYKHSDSYPVYLGKKVVDFCKTTKEWEAVKQKVSNLIKVGQCDLADDNVVDEYVNKGYCNTNYSDGDKKEFYCLFHNIQGVRYLEEIVNGNIKHLIDSEKFLKDSLFCEFAYIINLDTMELDFYEGFNKSVDKNSNLPFEQVANEDGYFPVKYVGSYKLDNIPENWMKKLFPKETD